MKPTIEQISHAILVNRLTVPEIAKKYGVSEKVIWSIMKQNVNSPTPSGRIEPTQ